MLDFYCRFSTISILEPFPLEGLFCWGVTNRKSCTMVVLNTKLEKSLQVSKPCKPFLLLVGGRNITYLTTLCKLYHFQKEKRQDTPKNTPKITSSYEEFSLCTGYLKRLTVLLGSTEIV
jgi:hypothetical protein